MVRFRLGEVLEAKGWTTYRLAVAVREEGADMSPSAVYRLARPGVRRVDLETLDVLCRVLDVSPGDLFDYSPGRRRGRPGGGRGPA